MFLASIRFMGAIVSDKDEDIARAAHEIVAYLVDCGFSWAGASDHVALRLARVIAYIQRNRT